MSSIALAGSNRSLVRRLVLGTLLLFVLFFLSPSLSAHSALDVGLTAHLSFDEGAGDYDGLLDEVRFYHRVLTPREVVDLFNATNDATPPSTPTGLATTSVSSLHVDLMWNASAGPESGIAEYVVYRDNVEVGRSLDDVLIFSRALSAAEVLDLFDSGN